MPPVGTLLFSSRNFENFIRINALSGFGRKCAAQLSEAVNEKLRILIRKLGASFEMRMRICFDFPYGIGSNCKKIPALNRAQLKFWYLCIRRSFGCILRPLLKSLLCGSNQYRIIDGSRI